MPLVPLGASWSHRDLQVTTGPRSLAERALPVPVISQRLESVQIICFRSPVPGRKITAVQLKLSIHPRIKKKGASAATS